MCKAGEDVGQPSKATQESEQFTHYDSFTKMPSAFM
jgi:hypothetical protein